MADDVACFGGLVLVAETPLAIGVRPREPQDYWDKSKLCWIPKSQCQVLESNGRYIGHIHVQMWLMEEDEKPLLRRYWKESGANVVDEDENPGQRSQYYVPPPGIGEPPPKAETQAAADELSLGQAYQTLGITVDDSIDQIKQKHRELVKANHPDKVQGAGLSPGIQKFAEEELKRINLAFEAVMRQRGFEDL